jgi:uncharacterized protein (DUF1697 family)
MSTYITMVRGINVGGAKKVLMKDLAALYESCGFTNVRTYVQSGNVILDSSEKNPDAIAKTVEKKIERKYKFHVDVVVRTGKDLEKVIAGNPFSKKHGTDIIRLYVTFLPDAPDQQAVQGLATVKSGADQYAVIGREVFLFCPDGYGRTKLTNNLLESKLKRVATTRNWNTVTTLYAMATGKG